MNMIMLVIVFMLGGRPEATKAPRDCYIIQKESFTECFTFHSSTGYYEAKTYCASLGGYLAQIKDEYTWKLLIQKYLQKSSYVWIGYRIFDNTLWPRVDLSNMTSYWSIDGKQKYNSYCVYAEASRWEWSVDNCRKTYDYLCQYNITSCDITAIEDPNAITKSCFSSSEIPFNGTVDVQCKTGYFLNTSSTIACRNAVWDDVQCIPGCPPPGKRSNAQLNMVKEYYKIGESISYTCHEGYYNWKDFRKDYFNLTCESDSTWSDKNVGYCGPDRQYSIVTIDLTTLNNDSIELDCDLEAVGKSWFHNGNYANTQFFVTWSGNLNIYIQTNKDLRGVYMCTGKVQNRLEIGKRAFELVNNTECQLTDAQISWKNNVKVYENDGVLLRCPRNCTAYAVTWYKDDEEIFGNVYHTFIQNTGLFSSRVALKSKGKYTCQISDKTQMVRYNVSHDVMVIPSVDTVCGTRRFYRSKSPRYQPWLALLRHKEEVIFYCYGTLLNERWVITAASCAVRFRLESEMAQIYAELGQILKKTFSIDNVKIHPQYKEGSSKNDVALVRLKSENPVNFTDDIFPLCITPEDIGNIHKCEGIADLNGTVASFISVIADERVQVTDVENMNLVPKKICRESKPSDFADDQFCAKFSGEKENNIGDIGSPLTVSHNGKRYLLGIYSSSGGGDNGVGNYDYFTGIFYHYNWIKKSIV